MSPMNMFSARSNAILVVTTILLGISLITVCLRCYARLRIVKAFGWDDRLMVVAAILNTGLATVVILGVDYGMGQKPDYFSTRPNDFRRAMLCWWLGQVFYVLTSTAARLSITIMLLRFTLDRIYRVILYVAMSLSIAVGVVFFFFTIFQCSPVEYYWDRLTIQGSCLNIDILLGIVYFYSAGALACDLTIGLLPAVLIRNLRISRRSKIGIAGILGLGCIASAAVIVRIPFLHHAKDPDFLHATTQISIWSNVEASLGITAGSLAHLRPLLRLVRKRSSSSGSERDTVAAG